MTAKVAGIGSGKLAAKPQILPGWQQWQPISVVGRPKMAIGRWQVA